jgi:sulfur carrier protein
VTILLNDRPTEIPEGATVASLLDSIDMAQRRVAVEVNGEIVPRTRYALSPLVEGDRLEVVQFVGGG